MSISKFRNFYGVSWYARSVSELSLCRIGLMGRKLIIARNNSRLIKLHWKGARDSFLGKKNIEDEKDKKETLAGDAF